jgi:hypothetical protein
MPSAAKCARYFVDNAFWLRFGQYVVHTAYVNLPQGLELQSDESVPVGSQRPTSTWTT